MADTNGRGIFHRIGRRVHIQILPRTFSGWCAVALGAASLVLVLGWSFMGPAGAWPAFTCALAGGGAALVAIFRHREHSVSVFAALVPFTFVLVFLAAELVSWGAR